MPSWTNTPSGTMRAVVLSAKGASPPSSCFAVDPAYPKPTLPTQDWVLVKVRAVGINRTDLRQRAGEPANPVSFGPFICEFHNDKPAILGEEFVGEVEVPGTNTDFKTGERVTGIYYGGGKAYDGCYAEYTIIRKEVCRRLPEPAVLNLGHGGVSWETLAAFPGTGWTAWGILFQSADTKQGDTVLVRGGTSSVGVWAILLAKARGCTVIATTRKEGKVDKLTSIGVDHVVIEVQKDRAPDFDKMMKDVFAAAPAGANTVVELVDPSSVTQFGLKVCTKFGTVVPSGILGKGFAPAPFTPAMIPSTRRLGFHAGFAVVDQLQECFEDIALGIQSGKYKKKDFLEAVLPLEKVGEAHDRLEADEFCGRVVLKVS